MNPINDLAFAYHDAMFNRFSDIVYQDRASGISMHDQSLVTKRKRPTNHETSVTAMFPQSWGSTALGFGGIGGSSYTTAYSIVIECNGEYAVYFGSGFAYLVKGTKEAFFDDIRRMTLASVSDAKTKYA